MYENLKCNEHGKATLLYELVKRGHYHAFSALRDNHYQLSMFTTEYQLRKAVNELVEEGLIETKFKGHNRYGYMMYRASDKAKELVSLVKGEFE